MIISGFRSMVFLFTQAMVFPLTATMGKVLAFYNMALGKPVVATDGGGTSELVIDGETGFLVKPKSIEEPSSKIEYLLDNEKIAYKMGIKGKERIKQEFSMEQMINKFIQIYHSICSK